MIGGKKVVATIEARMTSTRLPGKVMMPLAGKPVIAHMIERHRRSRYTDEVVVATTTNATDDPVIRICEEMKCPYFRGSESDVFGRVVSAGKQYKAEILVQGMADSPLVDWRTVDELIEMLVANGYDATSNEFGEDKYPDGFDMRIYNFPVLAKFEETHKEEKYREHPGYHIRKDPVHFKCGYLSLKKDQKFWSTLRLTLDTAEDYQLISAIFDGLYQKNPDFSSEDVIAFLKNRPDLVAINAEVVQKVPIA